MKLDGNMVNVSKYFLTQISFELFLLRNRKLMCHLFLFRGLCVLLENLVGWWSQALRSLKFLPPNVHLNLCTVLRRAVVRKQPSHLFHRKQQCLQVP